MGLFSSSSPESLGVRDGRLTPCPSTPNCVSSQDDRPGRRVEPLPFEGSLDEARARLLAVLEDLPRAKVVVDEGTYLRAEVTSALLRFVDDVELLIDPAAGVVHLRSASRLGRSDFGVNRRRAEEIRRRFLGQAS